MTVFVASWGADAELRALTGAALASCLPLFPEMESQGVGETAWGGQAHVTWLREQRETTVAGREDDRLSIVEGVALNSDGGAVVTAPELSLWPEHQLSELGDLDGQFAIVDAAPDRLDVAVDTLGMCPLYWLRIGPAWFVANRVEPLARLRSSSAIDLDAAAAFLSIGFVMGDRTLLSGIRSVPAGAHWSWRPDREPRLDTPGNPWNYIGTKRAPLDSRGLADVMIAGFTALGKWAGEVECGLTGGLDTRVILALLRAAGTPTKYITIGAEQTEDVVVARRIAAFAGLRHEVLPTFSGIDVKEDWDRASRKLIAQNDGLVSLWQAIDMLRPPVSAPVMVWGVGGSICRAFYGTPRHYVGLSGAALRTRFVEERTGKDFGLLTAPAAAAGRRQMQKFVDAAADRGLRGREIPDAFSIAETHCRWAGANARKAFPVPMYSPYATRPFLRAAQSFSPVHRFSEPLHFRLLQLLAPDLAIFPHQSGRWQSQIPYLNLLGGHGWRMNVRQGGHDPTGTGRYLLEKMRTDLAARCLDRTSSPLWQVVDRPTFEQVMTTDDDRRTAMLKCLFGAATLFEYEAFRTGT